MTADLKNLMTDADLATLPNDGHRYELIGGELFVSFPHDLPHQVVLTNLAIDIGQWVEKNQLGILVPGPGVILSDYDSVVPDLAFITREEWTRIVRDNYLRAAPALIVEVSSAECNTWDTDLKVKRRLYAKYGVQEYWIVDLENRSVLIFRLRDTGLEEVSILRNEDNITSPLLPGLTIKLSDVFNLPPGW